MISKSCDMQNHQVLVARTMILPDIPDGIKELTPIQTTTDALNTIYLLKEEKIGLSEARDNQS
jgi:hypothetical protein